MKVIKRDSRIKEFEFDRIENAVNNAYIEMYGDIREQNLEISKVLNNISEEIYSIDDDVIGVEEIQDIIVKNLKETNEEVATLYEEYRNERTEIRESKMKLIKEVEGLIDGLNTAVLLENSNKQSQLISTQRDLMAGEVSKYLSRKMIPKDILAAHDKGMIKVHDLDYFANPMHNCDLVNLKDMLDNGTVINKKTIRRPKSLRTAMTVVTQIIAQVASFQYGGQTVSLSHIAPYVRVSKEKIINKYNKYNINEEVKKQLIEDDLKSEIKDCVQTFNYQISTIQSTNGQSPFISLCIYLNEDPEYIEETAMLAEEFFKQRIEGMENEYGVKATQTFPKMLYFLDENNTYEGSEYFWLTKLAVESTSKRMNPDYISVKKMKEQIGFAFPCMGQQ